MAGFFAVKLKGTAHGQLIQSTLYYRTGVDIAIGDIGSTGPAEVASAVKAAIWTDVLQAAMNAKYTLNEIEVNAFDEGLHLYYTLPYVLNVGEQGAIAGDTLGPASCINIRFGFDRQLVGLAALAPHRGYVALGPVSEPSQVDGRLEEGPGGIFDPDYGRGKFEIVGQNMADNIAVSFLGENIFPIRVKGSSLLGFTGWADVGSYSVDPFVRYRRSRALEA